MTRRAYDVIVRVTVTARSKDEARRLVTRFLPNPEDEHHQPTTTMRTAGNPFPSDRGRWPNFPIDSWALLTRARVVRESFDEKRDRVTWEATEVS